MTLPDIPNFISLFQFDQRMKKAVDMVVQLQRNKFREEAQADNQEFLNQIESTMKAIIKESTNQPQTSYAIVASLSEFELKKILIDKIETKDEMIKTKMKTPLLDQTEGRREGDQAKKLSKSAHAEEHDQKVADLEDQPHQEFNTGNEDVSPVREALNEDEWHRNPSRPLTPNCTKSLFNEFLATPIDFSAFIMHQLKIENLTQEVLTGPTYDLIKGTCKSIVELEYHLEEVFKATNDRLDWHNPEGKPYPHDLSKPLPLILNKQGRQVIPLDHFINNDLEYLKRGSSRIIVQRQDDQLYKFREGDFKRLRRQDIEDMLLLLVQDKLTNLNLEERFALNVALRMLTRRIVIQERLEDLQLGVKSYQKKIKLTKPDTHRSYLKRMTAYTAYPDIQGIIYKDEMNRIRLMRIDELHKFSDGTLNY
ncbi:hypothetical protein Tco_1072112, partial [Tanacetum coccineum]